MSITITSSDGTEEVFEDKPYIPPGQAVTAEPPKEDVKAETEVTKAETPKNDEDDDDEEVGETIPRARYEAKIRKMEKRINAKHRYGKETEEMNRELFAERNAAQERVRELERERDESKSQAAKVSKKTREDFKDDEQWIEYLADLRFREAEAKREEERAKQVYENQVAKVHARHEEFKQTVDDWDEVIGTFQRAAAAEPALNIFATTEDWFWESPNSSRVIHHLGKNMALVKEIFALPPSTAIIRLEELGKELSGGKKAEPKAEEAAPSNVKPISKAPAPITPHTVNANPVSKAPIDMNEREYLAYDEQKRREARRRHN